MVNPIWQLKDVPLDQYKVEGRQTIEHIVVLVADNW